MALIESLKGVAWARRRQPDDVVYLRAMGATAIAVMNISGADPLGTLRVHGEEILPKLRDDD